MRTICFSALRGGAPILALSLLAATAVAQDAKPEEPKPPMVYQTFFLHHAVEQNQVREVVSVLQNELPRASRINYVASLDAISVEATPEDMAAAQKIVADLDRPIATWKLTYTLTETDGGHAAGSPQHVSVVVAPGSRTRVKLGNKVPLVTGSAGADATPSSQVQYIDVGLNIDAKIDGSSDTPLLETKIEQSNVAEERSGIGTQDPLIHQTSLESQLTVAEGKTLTIGTLDLPGSTRQEKIEVTAEKVRE